MGARANAKEVEGFGVFNLWAQKVYWQPFGKSPTPAPDSLCNIQITYGTIGEQSESLAENTTLFREKICPSILLSTVYFYGKLVVREMGNLNFFKINEL